jgi:hypothetical protein
MVYLLTSEKWQKIFIFSLIIEPVVSVNVSQWYSTKLESRRALDRSPPVLLFFLEAWRVKRKIAFMRFLRGALRHICVTPERKLTPHRDCICGLRCIERKMRSIF